MRRIPARAPRGSTPATTWCSATCSRPPPSLWTPAAAVRVPGHPPVNRRVGPIRRRGATRPGGARTTTDHCDGNTVGRCVRVDQGARRVRWSVQPWARHRHQHHRPGLGPGGSRCGGLVRSAGATARPAGEPPARLPSLIRDGQLTARGGPCWEPFGAGTQTAAAACPPACGMHRKNRQMAGDLSVTVVGGGSR